MVIQDRSYNIPTRVSNRGSAESGRNPVLFVPEQIPAGIELSEKEEGPDSDGS